MPIPASGRTFRTRYRIRLSDMDETGRLRLDAVARFLQDAATDDVEETGWGVPEHLWVIRAVRIEVHAAPLVAHPKGTAVDFVATVSVDDETVWESASTYLRVTSSPKLTKRRNRTAMWRA